MLSWELLRRPVGFKRLRNATSLSFRVQARKVLDDLNTRER
jgi:hypothetical protein